MTDRIDEDAVGVAVLDDFPDVGNEVIVLDVVRFNNVVDLRLGEEVRLGSDIKELRVRDVDVELGGVDEEVGPGLLAVDE